LSSLIVKIIKGSNKGLMQASFDALLVTVSKSCHGTGRHLAAEVNIWHEVLAGCQRGSFTFSMKQK